MGKPIVISIVGDNRDLNKAIGQSESRLSKFGKLGRTAALGLAAGAGIAVVGMAKLAKGAAEDQAAAARLAKQMQNSAGATKAQVSATEDWITKQGKALGVTDDELRPALGRLVTATGDVGKAQKLASLAMDVSAGTGKSLGQVSEAIMKAQNGQVGALGRLGVATKDASGKTLSFDQVTKNMAGTFGGQATTQANTLEGKMGRLKLMLSETGESIGAKLLPAITKVATWILEKAVPAVSRVAGVIATRAKPLVKQLGATFRDMQPTLIKVASFLGKVGGVLLKVAGFIVTKVLPPAIRLAGFLAKNLLSAAVTVIGGIVKVISKLAAFGSSLINAGRKAVEFGRTVIAKINGIPGAIKGAAGKLLGIGQDLISGLLSGIRNKAGEIAGTIQRFVIDKIPGPVRKALGIASPSKVFAGFGRNIIQGLVLGVRREAPALDRTMRSLGLDLATYGATTSGATPRALPPRPAGSTAAGAGAVYNINLTVPIGASPEDIGRTLVRHIEAFEAAGGRRRA